LSHEWRRSVAIPFHFFKFTREQQMPQCPLMALSRHRLCAEKCLLMTQSGRNVREVVIAHILDAVTAIGCTDRMIVTAHRRRGRRADAKMILQSTITCPNCGSVNTETMPTDACQFFYNCGNCGVRLKPKAGDCCVFCSYGDVPCPPIQEARENEPYCEKCQGTAKITDRTKNLEWFNLPAYAASDRPRSVMAMILAVLALLATGGAFCMFCL
jgi:ribosomal protein L32